VPDTRGRNSDIVSATRAVADQMRRSSGRATRALSIVAGTERAPLLSAADAVADRLAATVGPAARFLLDHHLAAGVCVLLSSSPEELSSG
jgi:phosphoserine phosphatase